MVFHTGIASGYWQVAMDASTKEKAAFVTSGGLYEWNVMPFRLYNAPSTFARLMELVLKGLHWKICLIYLDMIVMVPTFEEELERLKQVFERLAHAGLKLKPKKCFLFRKRVSYLGHVDTQKKASLPTLERWNKFIHGPFQKAAWRSKASSDLPLIIAGSSPLSQL